MTQYVVIYHDPKRDNKVDRAAHTVHVPGCADIARALRLERSARDLRAADLEAALIEAQYQGLQPSEASDMGDVDAAPCTRRKA